MLTQSVGPTAATANSRRRVVSAGRTDRPCRKPHGGYTALRAADPPYEGQPRAWVIQMV
jgi:hypothetical protein